MNVIDYSSSNYPPMERIRLLVNKKDRLIIIIYGKKDSCNSFLVCPIYIDTQCKS